MTKFQRGDVFLVDVPKMDKFPKGSPRPSYVLQGKHHFVMLHGSDEFSVPPRSVLAMPITSLENALAKGQRIAPSYVELDKQRHPFLDHDSYISTHQTMPLSRLWLHTPTGKIHPDKMFEVDLQMIRTAGLNDAVRQLAESWVHKQLQAHEKTLKQIAASREKPKGR